MKKYMLFVSVFILFISCNNEIDINAEWKDTPVIYGLINPDSSRHFIRIYRAFLDENTSAVELAKRADSIYYSEDLEVVIERKSNGQSITLLKIDGDAIGITMQDGIFANSPNILYTFTQNIDPDETYILRLYNPATGKSASAKTNIVHDFQISFPPASYDFNFASSRPITILWRSAKNGKFYDVVMRFDYEEWNINNPSEILSKSIEWKLASGVVAGGINGGEQLSVNITGKDFFTFIRSQLQAHGDLRRKAKNKPITLYFYAGGEELYNYIRVNRAQSGITSLQTLPEYTNVEGGLGILSSRRYKALGDLGLTPLTLDSLSCGAVTRDLNFIHSNCY
jgi:hypothetical protein